jgi:hypothetical protein
MLRIIIKRKMTYWIKTLILLALLLPFTNVKAGVGDFTLSIQNITQSAANKLEFDLYILDTDSGNPFYLSTEQFGILFNSDINTGTLSIAIDNTGSGLGTFQVIESAMPQLDTDLSYPGQTLIKLVGEFAWIQLSRCTLVSTVTPGTLVTHFILTSSVPFTANSTPNFIFTSSDDVSPLFTTLITTSDGSTLTPLPVTPGVNAIVYGNPILNPPPSTFNVTGGGSYCQGSGGLPVGLDDSENGVTYTLIKDGTPTSTTATGTGSALSFGNQLAGTYTVSGSNAGGTIAMTGEAVIEEILLPAAPVTETITQPTCTTATGSVVLSGLSPESWTINPGNITGNTTSTTIPDLSPSIYTFTVTVSGCTSAPGGEVVINAQPETPPKPVITIIDDYLKSSSDAGNQWCNSSGVIVGATEQIYTPLSNDNYYVIVTNADGCSSEVSDIISFATVIEKKGFFEGIKIYPNPAKDYLIIENNSLLHTIDFEIMNSNGKIIYNSVLNTNSVIDIGHFSPGIYCIRFKKGDFYPVFKFIKQ